MQTSADYPYLRDFLGAWFHQDYDIEGETVAEITAAFKRSCSEDDSSSLAADIAKFISKNRDSIDKEFIRSFTPDIEPTAFANSTKAFLEEILSGL